jgi:hypothetical protein
MPDLLDVSKNDPQIPLIEALRAIRREVPILLMTGYVGGAIARRVGGGTRLRAEEIAPRARDLAASLARVLHP